MDKRSITVKRNISVGQHKQRKETRSSLINLICKPNKTELMWDKPDEVPLTVCEFQTDNG